MIISCLDKRNLLRHSGLLLVVCFSAPFLGAQVELSTPMPEQLFPKLNEVLRVALTQSPQMIQKNIDLAQSEANRIISRAQMLPNVNTSVSYNFSEAVVSDNTDARSQASGFYYSAGIYQPLFRWGTLKAQADASKIQLSIAEKNYIEAYRTLALSLRSQFLGLIVRKHAVSSARSLRDHAKSVLAQQEDLLKNGRISQGEILIPQLQAQDTELALERSIEDLEQAKLYLIRTAGLESLSDEDIPNQIPAISYDHDRTTALLHHFLNVSWEDHLLVEAARDAVKVSQLQYKTAKYRLYPHFNLAASVSQSNSTNASRDFVSQVGVFSQSIGVNMNWTIFDGFATRGAKMSGLATIRANEREVENQTKAVKERARSLERQVGFAYRAAHLTSVRSDVSKSAVVMRKDEEKLGVASQASVEVAEVAASQTDLILMNQRSEFLSRWAEFVSVIGLDPILDQLPDSK
jgi:outer membrane protein TolC